MTDDQSGSDRLGEKLKRLAALDLDRKIFGAFDHRYQLNEPADPRDVAAFEELFQKLAERAAKPLLARAEKERVRAGCQ